MQVQTKVIEVSQGGLDVLFLPFGKLSAGKIEKSISKYTDEGYTIVSTEWIVNRFLHVLCEANCFCFSSKNDKLKQFFYSFYVITS